MELIKLDEILDAYSRLKSYIYYDNFNMILRQQLADFEFKYQDKLNDRLKLIRDWINTYLISGELNPEINKMIEESSCFALPKSFNQDKSKDNNLLISNTSWFEFEVEKCTYLFKGAIELHIIASLWILKEGVILNKNVSSDSYGYHLSINPETGNLYSNKLLFSRYFDKYQQWRDKGIKAAKAQIKEGYNVLLISLDIKDFFHSTHIDFNLLKKEIYKSRDGERIITDIIELISIKHTNEIKKIAPGKTSKRGDNPLLPIGLVSSGVIANWLMNDFDRSLKDKMAPIYYGRYVDDFFIVVSNINLDKNIVSSDKNIINWFKERYFYDQKPLKLEESDDSTQNEFIFNCESNHKKYEGLSIQMKKIRFFYCDANSPWAMLNNFQKKLEENSSAFWFLPEKKDVEGNLDAQAFDLEYEDTINKFRSISDVKLSRYGASVYLAKRLKLAIIDEVSDADNQKITKEVFRFFEGQNTLSFYSMWEKVFTYLVVTENIISIKRLDRQINSAIDRLKEIGDFKEDINIELLKSSLKEYLGVCLSMAFSLKPSLLTKI